MSRKILGKLPLLLGFAFLVLAAIFLSWRLIPAQGKEKTLTSLAARPVTPYPSSRT
jgi:hypothetical protein